MKKQTPAQRRKRRHAGLPRPQWWTIVAVVSIFTSVLAVRFTSATWQNPTCDPDINPDSCNAAAPINVSGASQTKNGPLTVTVNTGSNALTVSSGPTGSAAALSITSSGSGYGLDVNNTATGQALRVSSSGATTAVNITQNQSGGTAVLANVAGSAGGVGIDGRSTTGTTGVGVSGVGTQSGIEGKGQTNGVGVRGLGAGTGSGVQGTIQSGGTGYAGSFDGSNSSLALSTNNGRVTMNSGVLNYPTLQVSNTATASGAGSAITADNQSSTAAGIYGVGKNNFGVSGNTNSFNFAGVLGCYNSTANCATLGGGTYAGFFNGPILVEGDAQFKRIAAADSLQETTLQGQLGDNATIHINRAGPTDPFAFESSGNYMWMCNRVAPLVLTKYRSSDMHTVLSVALPANTNCQDMVFDGSDIWIASDGTVTGVIQVNAYTGGMLTIPIASEIKGVAYDGAYVWATGYSTDEIFRIDPATSTVNATFPALTGGAPFGITHAMGVIWVTYQDSIGGQFYVSRMNKDGSGFISVPVSTLNPQHLVFDGEYIWVASSGGVGQVARIDTTTNTQQTSYNTPTVIRDIVFDGNSLWVNDPGLRTLYVIRPLDGVVINTIQVPSPLGTGFLERIAFDGHSVWYSMNNDNLVGHYQLPWSTGYHDGSVTDGVSIYDGVSGTYTCVQSDGVGGIVTFAGLCP